MARFVLGVIALGITLWLVDRFTGAVPAVLWLIFWIGLLISFLYYTRRLVGFVRDRLLWRLRRRLIVTYVFIAVIPIFLILLLAGIGVLLLNAQFAAYLVAQAVQDRADRLQQLGRGVAHDAYVSHDPAPEALLTRMHQLFVAQLGRYHEDYPALEVTLRLGEQARAFDLVGKPLKRPSTVPAWLKEAEFAGVVMDEGRVIIRSVAQGDTPHGKFVLVLSAPVTSELLDQIGQGMGPVGLGTVAPETDAPGEGAVSPRATLDDSSRIERESAVMSKNVPVPAPVFFGDYTVFGALTLDPVVWGGVEKRLAPTPVFLYVTSRVMTLEAKLLSTLGRFSRIYAVMFVAVGVVFLIVVMLAILVGVRLTRSITMTVDELYSATERVRAGGFSHRIQMPARDQLTALGEAFDSMTASVERLLRESQEKSRLESELEIAREVQNRLFPRALPQVPGLELYGACHPARAVSGDYYDFIALDRDRVAIVLGDIAGKGISAALLMAAIQSSLRAQLYHGASRDAGLSAAEVVKRLNRQLFESTAADKYATFFYAVYDATTRELTYTNAGHLPPVISRRKGMERLREGGIVAGLFPSAEYAEAKVRLDPGDVFLAFTDGMTEPENIYEEEFGESRLIEIASSALSTPLEQVAKNVFSSVSDWTGSPELHDDMTIIVARATGGEK